MNVGELFVNLGIRGADKTVGAISSVKKGLGETASVSLEAKAAIVGAMYALERLFSLSGKTGTGLTNFTAVTGHSAIQLQQWQHAARQAGVANEEFTGSIKAVQGAMTSMLLGKGAPEGLAMVASKVGFDAKKARDSFYVLEQLQKFARQAPPDVGNAVLKSFGISEGVIAAMRRNMFRPGVMNQAPLYSQNQIAALDRANIGWSNLSTKIEMAIGKFNARHGQQIVKDISAIVDVVIRLAEALERVQDRMKLFERMSNLVEGVTNTIRLGEELFDKMNGKESKKGDLLYVPPGQEALPGLEAFRVMMGGKPGPKPAEAAPKMSIPLPAVADHTTLRGAPRGAAVNHVNRRPAIAPKIMVVPGAKQKAGDVKIEQNLHFQHDGKDHKKTSDSVKKASQAAYRQFAQGQVS